VQIQHDYITSPTTDDSRTHLDHVINDQIDCVTSPDGYAEVAKKTTLNDPFVRLFTRDRKSDVEEDLSPRDQLVLKYPCHAGDVDDEVRQCGTNFVSILFGHSILVIHSAGCFCTSDNPRFRCG
jgi:hypothetical protein